MTKRVQSTAGRQSERKTGSRLGNRSDYYSGQQPIPLMANRPMDLSGNLNEDLDAIIRTYEGHCVVGEDCIRAALLESMENPALTRNLTQGIYPAVAEACGVSVSMAGQLMHRWLKKTWSMRNRSNMDLWRTVMKDPREEVMPPMRIFLMRMAEQINSQYRLMQCLEQIGFDGSRRGFSDGLER